MIIEILDHVSKFEYLCMVINFVLQIVLCFPWVLRLPVQSTITKMPNKNKTELSIL